MVGIKEDNFLPVGCGRVAFVEAILRSVSNCSGRNPVRRAVFQDLILTPRVAYHAYRVLLGSSPLIIFDVVDHMVLPVPRVIKIAFISYLEQHVVEVIDRVDHLSHIRLLNTGDSGYGQGMRLRAFAVAVGVAVDALHVILDVER